MRRKSIKQQMAEHIVELKSEVAVATSRYETARTDLQILNAFLDSLKAMLFSSDRDTGNFDLLREIAMLKDYAAKREGKEEVAINLLQEENSKLWYLVRRALKDPGLDLADKMHLSDSEMGFGIPQMDISDPLMRRNPNRISHFREPRFNQGR